MRHFALILLVLTLTSCGNKTASFVAECKQDLIDQNKEVKGYAVYDFQAHGDGEILTLGNKTFLPVDATIDFGDGSGTQERKVACWQKKGVVFSSTLGL